MIDGLLNLRILDMQQPTRGIPSNNCFFFFFSQFTCLYTFYSGIKSMQVDFLLSFR